MSLHQVTFAYSIPETAVVDIDLDPAMDRTEQIEVALQDIKEIYDDVVDIEIIKIEVLN